MKSLFIKKIQIDWQRIPADSYLRNIQALQHINEIVLEKPVTFLQVRTEQENPHFWRR